MAWHSTWNDDDDDRSSGRYRYVRVGWQAGQRGTPGLWFILGITIFVYLFLQHSPAAIQYGPLSASDLFERGQVWRLLTFQFLHGGNSHIFWNMLILWMFGRTVEMQIGTRSFVWLYLFSGIAGGLAEALFNLTMFQITGNPGWMEISAVGASAGVMGMTIAFAALNPSAPILLFFILPVRAKYVAIGYFIVETLPLYEMLVSKGRVVSDGVAHAAHVGGMIYALVWIVLAGLVNRPWAHRYQAAFDRMKRSLRSSAPRREHPIVRGPNDTTGRTPPAPPRERDRDEERLDAILQKIHAQGLLSLTEDERRFLRQMSERKRDRS